MVSATESPVDVSGCTFDARAAKDCYQGIKDAECGSEEEFFLPQLPASCSEVYDCPPEEYDDEVLDDSGMSSTKQKISRGLFFPVNH